MSASAESNSIPRAIEAAPVDDGVKLMAKVFHENAKADREANRQGHAETRDAIRDQTKSITRVIGFGVSVGAVIIILVVILLGESRGVDTDKAANNTVKVLEALPTVAAPPGSEE